MYDKELKIYHTTLPTAEEAKEMTVNKDYQWLLENQFYEILRAINRGKTSCILISSNGVGYYKKQLAKEKLEKELIDKGYKITVTEDGNYKYASWA